MTGGADRSTARGGVAADRSLAPGGVVRVREIPSRQRTGSPAPALPAPGMPPTPPRHTLGPCPAATST